MFTVSLRGAGLGVVVVVGFGVLALGAGAVPSANEITIVVPGAMNLAVHCGGDQTYFADGEEIRVVPQAARCDIEAPLSPVMPVRGELEVGWAHRYRCHRQAMALDCAPE